YFRKLNPCFLNCGKRFFRPVSLRQEKRIELGDIRIAWIEFGSATNGTNGFVESNDLVETFRQILMRISITGEEQAGTTIVLDRLFVFGRVEVIHSGNEIPLTFSYAVAQLVGASDLSQATLPVTFSSIQRSKMLARHRKVRIQLHHV